MESNSLNLELFKQNHLTSHFDSDEFRIIYGKVQRKPLNFRSECVEQVKYLSKVATRPLAVLYSGGVDSEVICRSLSDANIPFTALIYQDVNELNSHESRYAIEEVKKRNWDHRIVEFDLLDWMTKDGRDLATQLEISEPELSIYLLRLQHAFELGFFPIDGRGDIALSYRDGEVSFSEGEQSHKAISYLSKNGIECCPKFFKYSPELILSWLQEPMMKIWVEYHEALNIQSTTHYKTMIHINNWHDLRPRRKYTGFEKILREYRILRDQLRENNWSNRSHLKTYAETILELGGSN